MQRWNTLALAVGGIHISLTDADRDTSIPCLFLLLLKKISSISSNTILTQPGLRQESNNLKGGIILWRSQGDTDITEPAQRYVYPLSIF